MTIIRRKLCRWNIWIVLILLVGTSTLGFAETPVEELEAEYARLQAKLSAQEQELERLNETINDLEGKISAQRGGVPAPSNAPLAPSCDGADNCANGE